MRIFSISLISGIFTVLSCNRDVESPEFLHMMENTTSGYLELTTYDGSNQVVHPDVLWDCETNQILLAITPYPDFQDFYENPSLYVSKDGMGWDGMKNPLVHAPTGGFNCDPDLFYDLHRKKKLIYVETIRNSHQTVKLIDVEGLPKLKIDTLLFNNFSESKSSREFILSPSLTTHEKKYWCYYVNLRKSAKKNNQVKLGVFEHLDNFDLSSFKEINLPLPDNYSPWHLDVFHTGKRFIMLLNGFYGGKVDQDGGSVTREYSIQVLSSTNGLDWKNHGDFIGKGNTQSEDICKNTDPYFHYVYRGTGFYSEKLNILNIWYSYVSTDNVWKLSLQKFYLSFD